MGKLFDVRFCLVRGLIRSLRSVLRQRLPPLLSRMFVCLLTLFFAFVVAPLRSHVRPCSLACVLFLLVFLLASMPVFFVKLVCLDCALLHLRSGSVEGWASQHICNHFICVVVYE